MVMEPPWAPLAALAESPLMSKVTPVAPMVAPAASAFSISAAYFSTVAWSLQVMVPPLMVILEPAAPTFTTFRPVRSESLIATTALEAEEARLTA